MAQSINQDKMTTRSSHSIGFKNTTNITSTKRRKATGNIRIMCDADRCLVDSPSQSTFQCNSARVSELDDDTLIHKLKPDLLKEQCFRASLGNRSSLQQSKEAFQPNVFQEEKIDLQTRKVEPEPDVFTSSKRREEEDCGCTLRANAGGDEKVTTSMSEACGRTTERIKTLDSSTEKVGREKFRDDDDNDDGESVDDKTLIKEEKNFGVFLLDSDDDEDSNNEEGNSSAADKVLRHERNRYEINSRRRTSDLKLL